MIKVMSLAKKLCAADPNSAGMDFDWTFYKRGTATPRHPIPEDRRAAYIAQARDQLKM